jgi:hypothetical protein
MDSFFCFAGGKKLPGKHGQQSLIAALPGSGKSPKPFHKHDFPIWHGFRTSSSRTKAWES